MGHLRDRRPETQAAQALGWIEPSTHAFVPPIHPSTSYERGPDGGYPGGHSYTRDQNPTYDQVEGLLAELEGGSRALLFSSGMSAAATVFDALEPGAHVVAPEQMYFTIRGWLVDLAKRGRIELDFVPNGDEDALARAVRPGSTRLVWIETPSNPTCAITDIARAAEISHDAGALIAADSTMSTPVLTRPLEHGVDLVMHSATKQLNGHGDVLAGGLVTAREDGLWERIAWERGTRGAVLGPFEAWLLLRGMRTLFLRVSASCRGAQRVAEALDAHPQVLEVFYPGLRDHPAHAIASRQMQGGFGSLLSFRVVGGEKAARAVASGLEIVRQGTSLGSVESLIEHRASIEGAGSPVAVDLLRLSVGIEHPDDLVADLERALASV